MACLDTTILIDLAARNARRKEHAVRKIEELAKKGQSLATTRFNVAELYVGVARSRCPQEDERALATLLSEFEILEFNDAAARIFGAITAFLQQIGRPIGDMDVLIAATAMSCGHSLITRDSRHFRHVPTLIVEDY
ncbi:MAG TPA: type II toxin-antitoxin system VapC family toxin [Sedimentisphaerales bacterium]|jgi:tRNA(fMet)-specific endonuclease VapC|nr:type II toxin-antitoxin system VapC family toxin [Sedimentisphaerales bacterium]HNU31350.1 type II toxin-antitoxin system VapC family toxin [Sedimentisphaerales bacterium]